MISNLTGPNGLVGPLICTLIGGAQPTMAGGPLSHCAINRGGGRWLKSRGSSEPSSPPTNPKPDLVRGAANDGKHLHHRTAPPSVFTASLHHPSPSSSSPTVVALVQTPTQRPWPTPLDRSPTMVGNLALLLSLISV